MIAEPAEPQATPWHLLATRKLTTLIERSLDPHMAATHYEDEIRAMGVTVRRTAKLMPKRAVAIQIHFAIDHAMRLYDASDGRESAAKVRCSKGCSACCYQHTGISEPEAELLVAAVKTGKLELDRDRLERQAGRDDKSHQELSHADRACVFLKDGLCQVYQFRPAACRTYRVITDPVFCDTETNPGSVQGEIAAFVTPGAEVIVSAAMRSFRYGGMADFLIEKLP